MKPTKITRRNNIRFRIRAKVVGTAERPRISVYRSNKAIYAQIIDDTKGVTLVAANSLEDAVQSTDKRIDQSKAVGKLLAERALAGKIENVVFDRGGYLYHGRVKALADSARETGLKF